MGDWKSALNNYRAGLAEDPESPTLREKFAQAKHEAASGAWRKAQACAASNEWQCAMAEADYALTIDEGNTGIAVFRANAARTHAFELLRSAREASTRGDFVAAFGLLNRGTTTSKDPAVQSDAAAARTEILKAAQREAERLSEARHLQAAVELWTLIAQVDGSKLPQLKAARAEYDQQLTYEYEQHARHGDAALHARRWPEAEQHYLAGAPGEAGGPRRRARAVRRRGVARRGRRFGARLRGGDRRLPGCGDRAILEHV